jgi:CubicO group peptidase (beta-lactamase class C family)
MAFDIVLAMWNLGGIFWLGVSLVLAGAASAEELKLVFPVSDWERVKPETMDYSSEKLEALRVWLKTQKTTAMQVSVKGRVIFEYGDVKVVSKVASVRKSVLAMMYGKYHAEGKIDLKKTVEQLGLTDVQPFLPIEKGATLYDLLTARSGIYLPSGNEELTAASPRRGAQTPGTYFQYQNWDFNAAGTAFEKVTGRELFEALETDVAKPIGMQDFARSLQRKNSSLPDSVHPEYAMYLSTRDMGRLGLLMLADGNWNGRQVMPKGWAARITTLVTPHSEMHPYALSLRTRTGLWGYGMLWWVWDAPNLLGMVTGPFQGAYSAIGANGQYITVLPAMDLVLAHKVNFDEDGGRQISPGEFQAILQLVIESGCNGSCR